MASTYTRLYLLCIFLNLGDANVSAQKKIADTVYYNDNWSICERPIASFFRVGTLAISDSIWYYTGKVEDYTMDSLLIMEGAYSDKGLKSGPFKFYYANGKLSVSGNYANGKVAGNWHWYYPSGSDEAEIYFPSDVQDFKFISFKDENGATLLANGDGSFTWNTYAFSLANGYIVHGKFKSGKRSGKWEFSSAYDPGNVIFKEWYNEDGKFEKGKSFSQYHPDPTRPFKFNFYTPRLEVMESFVSDGFFRKNGDSLAASEMISYLEEHKPSEIKVKYKSFDSAFAFMIQSLYDYAWKFDIKSKDINADIEFRLGFKGSPEDITVTGSGLDTTEKKFLNFLISKYSDIEMPGTKTIGIEGYHDIYMYTINLSVYFPADMKEPFGNELFFTVIPRKKMLALLDEHKKDIKKFIRKIRDL